MDASRRSRLQEMLIVQEEEILHIRVKPGWKKGTKITFKGKGDQKPGTLPADIAFVMDEKRHPVYKRLGDDLELGVEIPLPGWKKGTKITFKGKGDQKPGTLQADIAFVIDEKRHPVYKRLGNDLELGVEIPLVQALTCCTITIPLLGGEKMTLSFDDILYQGCEKIIPGQGMPKPNEEGRRGDLQVKFLIKFPDELSQVQRSEIVGILRDCS
ncbi:unnamed protein product [Ilex paraguariensis]|uniref:Chaperone DnaJ C-terminal domain-containing protein n=1 Tax=Ilex paraguariensis TaxID=185542 RepID=A0ABC8SZB7_9AQUA